MSAKLTSALLISANLFEACLVRTNLDNTFMRSTNLRDADGQEASFCNAINLLFLQLHTMSALYGATLPDRTRLSGRYSLMLQMDSTWQKELKDWQERKSVGFGSTTSSAS